MNSIECKNIHIFFLIDISMSMRDNKKSSVNHVLSHLVENLLLFKQDNQEYNLYVYDILYSNFAEWGNLTKPTAIELYSIPDYNLSGLSNIGDALQLLSGELQEIDQNEKKYIVIISDGNITDDRASCNKDIYTQKNVINYAILIGQNEKIKSYDLIEIVQNIDNIYLATECEKCCEKLIAQIQHTNHVDTLTKKDNSTSLTCDDIDDEEDNKDNLWED